MEKLKRYDAQKEIMNETLFDFANIAQKVSKLIQRNEHGEALAFISKTLGFNKYAKIFNYINEIQKEQGYLNYNLGKYRDDMSNELHTFGIKKFGEPYLIIKGAL